MYYKPLLTLLKIFALYKDRANVRGDIHSSVIIVFFSSQTIHSLHQICLDHHITNINLVLHFLGIITATLTILVGIAYSSFAKKQMFIQLHQKIQKLCMVLKVKKIDISKKFLWVHVHCLLVLIADSFYTDMHLLSVNLYFYLLMLMVIEFYCVLKYILLCCRGLKVKIVRMVDDFDDINDCDQTVSRKGKILIQIH